MSTKIFTILISGTVCYTKLNSLNKRFNNRSYLKMCIQRRIIK